MNDKKKESKLYTGLLTVFYIIYSLLLLLVIVISLLNPQNNLTSKQEKTEASLDYLKAHKSELFSVEHFTNKIVCNFATGTMNCNEFLWNDSDGTIH